MKITPRVAVSLLFVSIFSSLIVQYPLFKYHPGNWDHHLMVFLADTISHKGYAPWIANWSSYFGFHRTSYPQGAPFFLSSFQQIVADYSEWTILIYSFLISLTALFSVFSLSLLIRKKDYLFAFFFTFVFSTAPSYLYIVEWTASARGLFISLLPFLVISTIMLLKNESMNRRWVFLAFFSMITLFSIHRFSFFVSVTLIPSFIITLIIFINKKNIMIFSSWWSEGRYKRYALSLLISIFLVYSIYIFYTQQKLAEAISESYTSGKLLTGYSPVVRAINLLFSVVASAGLLAILLPFSIIEIFRKKMISPEIAYMTLSSIFLMFIIFYPLYFRPYAVLFLSFFIALHLISALHKKPHNEKKIFRMDAKSIYSLLVVSMLFSLVLQAEWNGALFTENKQWMDWEQEETINTVQDLPAENVFIGTTSITRFSSLYSDKFSIPPGGYRYDLCAYLFAERPDIMSVNDLNLSFQPQVYWSGKIYFYSENINVSDNIAPLYMITYYNFFETDHDGHWKERFSNDNVTKYTYIIYSNDIHDIYFVDSSNPNIQKIELYFAKP